MIVQTIYMIMVFCCNDVIDLKENIDMVYDEFVKINHDYKSDKLKQDMLNESLGLKAYK